MHGLMGDRLLKRFLKGIRRASNTTSAKDAEPEGETEVKNHLIGLEQDLLQGKEAEKIGTKDEDSKPIGRNDDSDETSDAVLLSDDLHKTK